MKRFSLKTAAVGLGCILVSGMVVLSCAGSGDRLSRASFAEGTPVLTAAGQAPIETAAKGTIVPAWSWESGTWEMTAVASVRTAEYEGEIITVRAAGASFEATPDHPFWIVYGADLEKSAPPAAVPAGERGMTERGRWVEARDLLAGDVLLGKDGRELVVDGLSSRSGEVTMYNLELEKLSGFAVGAAGILVSSYREAAGERTEGGSGCFAAGTEVMSAGGPLSIEAAAAGLEVYARGDEDLSWEPKEVLGLESLEYEGDVVKLRAGGSRVEVTGNHPFWVVSGEELEDRPLVRDVSRPERAMTEAGRWVEARDLRRGDALLSRSGERLAVEGLSSRRRRLTVYNLKVADYHSYAVSPLGILVHNKGSEESPSASADESMGSYGPAEKSAPAMPEGSTDSEPKKTLEPSGEAAGASSRPTVSGLRAGYADDNRQFNYFVKFLREYGQQVEHFPIDVEERVILSVLDADGRSMPNATVTVRGGDADLCRGLTHADGSFLFFPSEYEDARYAYEALIEVGQRSETLVIDRQGPRRIEVRLPSSRPQLVPVPLDLLFVLDTTGSMGEEIERLKATIEIINLNLAALSSRPSIRFGMVLYKDRGDEYVTRPIPFTSDIEDFETSLNAVSAGGGGDGPEDLQSALREAVEQMDWRDDAVRLAFVITDASPHLDYRQDYTYVRAARAARTGGIKLFTVGTGGLNLMGEYVLRQISQYTGARYIFLTYGESGESEGGAPGSVSHHTGENFQTDKLEAIIIRFAREELQHLTDSPIEEADEYFEARKIDTERKEETLEKLFGMAASQLIDYSSLKIPAGTPAAVLPVVPATPPLALAGEYFTEQLLLALVKDEELRKTFRTVERKDLQPLFEELELQLSELADDGEAARVGRLLGAELLFSGKLYRKGEDYELFLKLLRVETGEILSITKAQIGAELGI